MTENLKKRNVSEIQYLAAKYGGKCLTAKTSFTSSNHQDQNGKRQDQIRISQDNKENPSIKEMQENAKKFHGKRLN